MLIAIRFGYCFLRTFIVWSWASFVSGLLYSIGGLLFGRGANFVSDLFGTSWLSYAGIERSIFISLIGCGGTADWSPLVESGGLRGMDGTGYCSMDPSIDMMGLDMTRVSGSGPARVISTLYYLR